jgi:hypothetical protein
LEDALKRGHSECHELIVLLFNSERLNRGAKVGQRSIGIAHHEMAFAD